MVEVQKINYSHYGQAVKLSNGKVDVIVTTDVGPRIIFYGFTGGENVLAEMGPEDVVETDLGSWHPWGGHRLWTAPEAMPRSYSPDNDPVEVETIEEGVVSFRPPLESGTGIQKEMVLGLQGDGTTLEISHHITNKGLWAIETAPWGLTIVKGGGTTIFPQEPFAAHGEVLLPARPMVMWNYTDLSDPRWTWGKKFVQLRTDEKLDFAQKIGAAVKAGWAAYLRGDLLFVKRFLYEDEVSYPDFGCNFETFTKGNFMEVETLGWLEVLEPEETASHVEQWSLFDGIKAGATEDSLEAALKPALATTV